MSKYSADGLYDASINLGEIVKKYESELNKVEHDVKEIYREYSGIMQLPKEEKEKTDKIIGLEGGTAVIEKEKKSISYDFKVNLSEDEFQNLLNGSDVSIGFYEAIENFRRDLGDLLRHKEFLADKSDEIKKIDDETENGFVLINDKNDNSDSSNYGSVPSQDYSSIFATDDDSTGDLTTTSDGVGPVNYTSALDNNDKIGNNGNLDTQSLNVGDGSTIASQAYNSTLSDPSSNVVADSGVTLDDPSYSVSDYETTIDDPSYPSSGYETTIGDSSASKIDYNSLKEDPIVSASTYKSTIDDDSSVQYSKSLSSLLPNYTSTSSDTATYATAVPSYTSTKTDENPISYSDVTSNNNQKYTSTIPTNKTLSTSTTRTGSSVKSSNNSSGLSTKTPNYEATKSNGTSSYHSGGTYSGSGYKGTSSVSGYKGTSTKSGGLLSGVSNALGNSIGDVASSIEGIVKGKKYSKIPTASVPLGVTSVASKGSVIPIAAGLGAAGASGLGAKMMLDKRKKEDEEEEEDYTAKDNLNLESDELSLVENHIKNIDEKLEELETYN